MLAPVPHSPHKSTTCALLRRVTKLLRGATELCRSATPAEQSSAFVRSVYVVARVNTHVVVARAPVQLRVPRTSFSFYRRESAGNVDTSASFAFA